MASTQKKTTSTKKSPEKKTNAKTKTKADSKGKTKANASKEKAKPALLVSGIMVAVLQVVEADSIAVLTPVWLRHRLFRERLITVALLPSLVPVHWKKRKRPLLIATGWMMVRRIRFTAAIPMILEKQKPSEQEARFPCGK